MVTTEIANFDSEFRRLRKLSEFDLDYLELHDEVKNLIEIAGIIAGTEISVLNLMDHTTQWSVSSKSRRPNSSPREDSICNYTIQSADPLEITRLDLDARFSEREYVKAENGFKYYLGIPIRLRSGENIGALCLLDRKEMKTSAEKQESLQLVVVEIVQKLEAKKELDKTLFSLSEITRIKNQVAHDVRGPLSGITALAEVVESEDIPQEEMREYFRLIKESGRGVLDLTEEILKNSRAGKMFRSTQINLVQLKEKLDKLYQLSARTKKVDFEVSIAAESKPHFFSKRKLLSIVGNLISNAIKFTAAGGRVYVNLAIKNSDNGKILIIRVSDTGKGFSKEAIEDFHEDKLESTLGVAGEKGFGVGLKLVQEMVNELSGTMQIFSEENKGTEIEVKLPV